MKICFKCKVLKPLSEYYHHSQMADKHVNKCKSCNKQDVIQNRNSKINYYRNYDRIRGSRQTIEKTKEWRNKYPAKHKAQTLIHNALRINKITRQPCEECGSEYHIHAHHDDYLKPFDVRWLCAAHHAQWHKKYGEAKNGSVRIEDLEIRSITQFNI